MSAVPLATIAAAMTMSCAALSVSVRPLDQARAAATTISPASPLPPPVCTSILPTASWLSITEGLRMDLPCTTASLVIAMSAGSSNNVPAAPLQARRSATPPNDRTPWLDTSAIPGRTPLADTAPAKSVAASDHTTMLPPAPLAPSASMRAPAATDVTAAVGRGALSVRSAALRPPRRSPPSRMRPPSVAPLADMRAAGVISSRPPVAVTRPPVSAVPRAVIMPATCAVPPAVIATVPPRAPSAETVPLSVTLPPASSTTRPSRTLVPAAWTKPPRLPARA